MLKRDYIEALARIEERARLARKNLAAGLLPNGVTALRDIEEQAGDRLHDASHDGELPEHLRDRVDA